MRFIAIVALLLASVLVTPATAQVKVSGLFVAKQACPAVQSIKKQTNPGNITLSPGKGYKLIGANTTPATYYWIAVPGAAPNLRWVPVSCGTPAFDQPDVLLAPPSTDTTTTIPTPPATGKAEYVLAISWEPAFCEGLPDKTECRNETAASYEATHFSLHGLWPQPRSKAYCGVSATDQASDKAHAWDALPAVNLTPSVKSALDHIMPGTQSLLERHEWIVHGTCSGASQDTYFGRAALFADTINSTAVAKLFADNIGKRLDGATIRQAFDTAFGKGAGDRVRIACDNDGSRRLISEITIGLRGDVMGTGGIGEMIAASAATDRGCTGGIIDPVGSQ